MGKGAGSFALAMAAVIALAGCQPFAGRADPQAQRTPSRMVDTGGACGGFAGFSCRNPGDFCRMAAGTCQVADNMGVCTTRRPACTREFRPVCGCDGRTYANACEATAAGANISAEGECPQA